MDSMIQDRLDAEQNYDDMAVDAVAEGWDPHELR
jgi:hypothetical protein